jgi:hypothetical protein
MNILNCINERNLEVEPRLKLSLEFFESMEEKSVIFWNNHSET